jgi:alginate O-acetyltransferase complex protein AlgI
VAQGKYLPGFSDTLKIIRTFLITTLAWVFFRSESISAAFEFLGIVFRMKDGLNITSSISYAFSSVLIGFFIVEWINRTKHHGFEIQSLNVFTRWISYLLVLFLIIFFTSTTSNYEFIYFQF